MNDEKTPYSFQQELKEKGLNKRQFARMVGRHEKTVQAWGNDIPNWARVVLDTFDPADLNKRLIYCESVIESFRKDIQRLQEVSEEFRKQQNLADHEKLINLIKEELEATDSIVSTLMLRIDDLEKRADALEGLTKEEDDIPF